METDSGSSSDEEEEIHGSKFVFKYLLEVEMRRAWREEERRDKELKLELERMEREEILEERTASKIILGAFVGNSSGVCQGCRS